MTPDSRSSSDGSKYKLQFYQLWLNLIRLGYVWLVYNFILYLFNKFLFFLYFLLYKKFGKNRLAFLQFRDAWIFR